ncbi:hypothetical protein HRG_004462 [Hirsutella rhossiliensis]|uniref:Uncharacterized protein n=1 Tax=Hirsutella rhossiliensis TaxID=111463 RepID=A0A9P8N154_9HYPO|nr:uncharacterized protein HRG_04462 [Hirsutella rhossiliensis]KAH0964034.1 hypothetical protein HRG_04462 [Hirsutella rhossiliensis]
MLVQIPHSAASPTLSPSRPKRAREESEQGAPGPSSPRPIKRARSEEAQEGDAAPGDAWAPAEIEVDMDYDPSSPGIKVELEDEPMYDVEQGPEEADQAMPDVAPHEPAPQTCDDWAVGWVSPEMDLPMLELGPEPWVISLYEQMMGKEQSICELEYPQPLMMDPIHEMGAWNLRPDDELSDEIRRAWP